MINSLVLNSESCWVEAVFDDDKGLVSIVDKNIHIPLQRYYVYSTLRLVLEGGESAEGESLASAVEKKHCHECFTAREGLISAIFEATVYMRGTHYFCGCRSNEVALPLSVKVHHQ